MKREAVLVLKEIIDTCRDEITIAWVSLDPLGSSISRNPDSEGGYLIRMNIGLDRYSREKINSVLKKHGLVLRKEKGFVVISKVQPEKQDVK
jgi:hypothetical protein